MCVCVYVCVQCEYSSIRALIQLCVCLCILDVVVADVAINSEVWSVCGAGKPSKT